MIIVLTNIDDGSIEIKVPQKLKQLGAGQVPTDH